MADDVSQESEEVSLAAKMWVQIARDLKGLFTLIPPEDVTDVMVLVMELWESDPARVEAASQKLYAILDNLQIIK